MSDRRERASIERAGGSPPGRPARARVSCAVAEMAGARALVAACWSWWWLTLAAGEYLLPISAWLLLRSLRRRRSADRTAAKI